MKFRACTTVLFLNVLLVQISGRAAEAGQAGPAYVVVVDYSVDASHLEDLKTLISSVARTSIGEPGCQRFDVVQPLTQTNHITLYEVFDNETAFQVHAASAAFKQFVKDAGAINATRSAVPGTMLMSLQKP